MNNKEKGTSFEEEFAMILYQYGFWVRLDRGKAQTMDVFAARNNIAYLFECKVCSSDYFDFSRISDNQMLSKDMFKSKGNENVWIVYKLEGKVYLSKEFIKKPSKGIRLEDWIGIVNK